MITIILTFLVVGLIAGFAARALVPGNDAMGILPTILLGIVGAFIGGFIGSGFTEGGFSGFSVWGLVLAILGAVLALLAYNFITSRTRNHA